MNWTSLSIKRDKRMFKTQLATWLKNEIDFNWKFVFCCEYNLLYKSEDWGIFQKQGQRDCGCS